MAQGMYHIICETTEGRVDEVESLDEAIRIARALMEEVQFSDPVAIEQNGKVIHQFVRTVNGEVEEETIC